MAERPRPGLDWRAVVEQTASWLVIGAICGVGWLSWHVPRQLDRILQNQKQLTEEADGFSDRFKILEASDRAQDQRLIRLEAMR